MNNIFKAMLFGYVTLISVSASAEADVCSQISVPWPECDPATGPDETSAEHERMMNKRS